jgi:predicted ATPase
MLFTARPEFAAPWPSRAHHAQIMLNRLDRRETRDMVTRVAAETPLPADVVETLVRRTDGVPLFIEELTRLLLERGPGAGHGNHHERGEIPATLEDSLMARLDRLGTAKEVAQVAAVIGREFSYALLQAVLPLRERDLQASLDALAEAELIYTRGLPPEATYLFKHALVQDAAYAALLHGRRRELHRATAAALRDRFPETAAAHPELLAHHHTEAGDAEPAVAAWHQVAQLALARSAYPEAIGHVERGLAVLSTLPHSAERSEKEIALRSIFGVGLVSTKGYGAQDVEQNYSRAQQLCEELGASPQLIPTLYGLWTYHLFRDHREATFKLAEQLQRLARCPEHVHVATMTRGITAFWDGNLHAARELLTRAVELYDPRYHPSFAQDFSEDAPLLAHRYLIWCLVELGYFDQARAQCELIKGPSEKISSPYVVAVNRNFEITMRISLREPEVVRDLAEKLLTLSVEQHFSVFFAVALCGRGWAMIQQGDAAEGIAEMRQGLSVLDAGGAMIGLSYWVSALLEGFLEPERASEGLVIVEQALAQSRHGLTRYYDSQLQRLKAELLLLVDPSSQSAAEDCMRHALRIAGQQGAKAQELRAAMSLSRLLHQQGRTGEARSLLSPIHDWFTEGLDTTDLREARALLARLR